MATATLEKPQAEKAAPANKPKAKTVIAPKAKKPSASKKPKMQKPKATQLNVRIEPALKAEGDRVLAEMGLSPSEAIRLFYEYLVANRNDTFSIYETLRGSRRARSIPSDEGRRKLAALEDTRQMLQAMLGDNYVPSVADGNYKELIEEAIWERHCVSFDGGAEEAA